MRTLRARRTGATAGFTLAEAAVTIAIVAIVLVAVMQGLKGAEMAALHTKLQKTAYELGTGLLGEVRVGLYREELETGMSGDFSDQEEPMFRWEISLGEDVFSDSDDDEDRPFDNFQDRREREEELEDERDSEFTDEDEEEVEEPFEKVKIRVTYPPVQEYPTEMILEAWVPWEEVYGVDEEEEAAEGAETTQAGAGGAAAGGQAPGAAAGGTR